MPLNNGGAIKVTTARYYTPNGHSIQAKGIVPDIVIDRVKIEKIKTTGFERFKEKDLDGHLENTESVKVTSLKDKTVSELFDKDYELKEAYSLLKGMFFSYKMNK